MKKKYDKIWKMTTASILLFISLGLANIAMAETPFTKVGKIKSPTLMDIQKAYNDYFSTIKSEKKSGWKQFKRWEYFWKKRLSDDGIFPNMNKIYDQVIEFESSQKNEKNRTQSIDWTLMGPIQVPEATGDAREQGLGRINIVRFHPTNPNVIWVGAASGGVWKSTDGGNTWFTFPFTNFMSLSVSDIAVCKNNPDIVYVATGDSDGTPSSGGEWYSIGIIKTTDGGVTWAKTGITRELANGYLINRLLVDPTNDNIVIAGAADGIYKSADGGVTWSNKQNGNFKDLEFKPNDPNVVYGATLGRWSGNSSIWKSTNKGDSWTMKKQGGDIAGTSRICLEVVDNPAYYDYLYVLASDNKYEMFHSYLISDDAGNTFELYANRESTGNILGRYDGGKDDNSNGQAWYDMAIAVDPTNPNNIFTGGINIWSSKDGGGAFGRATHWQVDPKYPYVHADIHDLEYQPVSNKLFAVHDGGIDKYENGTWNDITGGISITQFYRIGVSQAESNVVVGGAQDNGTSMLKGGKWSHVYAGDGMECAIDPKDPKKMYVSLYNGVLRRSTDGGSSFLRMIDSAMTHEEGAWVTPFAIDPSNTSLIYAGYRSVWRSSNYGQTWNAVSSVLDNNWNGQLLSLAVSPSDPNTIYAATSGNIFKTKNVTTWTKMAGAPGGTITSIAVHPTNPDRIWVSVSNYTDQRKVFEYDGTAWKNLSGNLPNVPVNSIVYQKGSNDRLYIGTDIGVYYTDGGSTNWKRLGNGMPNIVVEELEIHEKDKKLYAGTYARGIWQIDLIDCNLSAPTITAKGNTQFCKGDSVELEAQDGYVSYLWSNGETTRSVVVKESGEFHVTGFDNEGCSATSEAIEITQFNVPDPKITVTGGKFPLCEGETDPINLSFSAPFGFQEYLWSNGGTERKITVTEEGEYYFTGTTKDGCKVTSEKLYVKHHPLPEKPVITQEWLILTSTTAKTYQWYLNDQKITGATERTYKVTQIGKYQVEIADSNSCVNISDYHDVTTDVEEIIDGESIIKLIPNPSFGVFNFEMFTVKPGSIEIKVRDIVGTIILSGTYTSKAGLFTEKFDLSSISSGIYFFDIKYNGKHYVLKAIKN
jgi:photosystem II stability/assembly factor-like uncharacterized protein